MADPATPRFHYPPVAEYTGLVQFAIDRMEVAQITSGERSYGQVRRGEVVKMKRGLAARMVARGGNFSHVAADTPEGQPEEYRPAKKVAPEPTDAALPILITVEQTANLVDLGWSDSDISAMTPQRAHEIIAAGERKGVSDVG